MTPQKAVKKLTKTRFTLRELAALITATGVPVSYSTISRIGSDPNYTTSRNVAKKLIKMAERVQ